MSAGSVGGGSLAFCACGAQAARANTPRTRSQRMGGLVDRHRATLFNAAIFPSTAVGIAVAGILNLRQLDAAAAAGLAIGAATNAFRLRRSVPLWRKVGGALAVFFNMLAAGVAERVSRDRRVTHEEKTERENRESKHGGTSRASHRGPHASSAVNLAF